VTAVGAELTRTCPGNAIYAGAFAALMANVVLIAYVLVAVKEDQSDAIDAQKAKKAKKAE
jgi:vacuolar ATPase assembly integral membrane protein VMA21